MKFSSKIEKCGLSPIRKFIPYSDKAESAGVKIYHLNIGQPDIITPPAYFEALRSFHEPVLQYAPSAGIPVLLDAVKDYYAAIGVELDRSEIMPTTGGSEGFQMTLAVLLDDGDEIIVPEPFYPNYNTSALLAGATIHAIPTSPETGYHYADRALVESCINEHTRAIMISNPGNPTGSVLTPDELKLMLDIAKEHNLFIIIDEVYREFVYGGEPLTSALQYEGYDDNIIIIDSVSKRFSACGARIGLVISHNKEFMAHIMKWCQCRLSVSTVDQIAAAALYNAGNEYFAEVREEYKRRRNTMMEKLNAIPGIIYAKPQGAFYIMAALPIDDAEKFQLWLLNEFRDNGETVMFACGEPFYATEGKGKNEVRMAYVLNEQDLARAMDLLKLALEQYNSLG